MNKIQQGGIAAAFCFAMSAVSAAPTVGSTTVLGTVAGPGALKHPDNLSPQIIAYYGTDLGLTYTHGTHIRFLFGDTWLNEQAAAIEPPNGLHDDMFGSVDLNVYGVSSSFTPLALPLIKLGQQANSVNALGMNPTHVMDIGKTPLGGFSSGSREFGMFTTTKPLGCRNDADCTAGTPGLTCDIGLGFSGAEYFTEKGITGGCLDTQFGCLKDTMANANGTPIPNTGFCRDTTSTSYKNTAAGRLNATAVKILVGIRNTTDARQYTSIKQVFTAKFQNASLASVQTFVPANGSNNQDYNPATGSGSSRRVFLWGRSAFVGVNATGRTAGLYFAYVDLPTGDSFPWTINYFTGMSGAVPLFSTNQANAVALDLNSTVAGTQTTETYDVVNQMSIIWIDHLHKWVMFYGGGMSKLPKVPYFTCGVLEVFTGPECTQVVIGNGAIRMRTADSPWGPWAPPVDVIVGGVPSATPLQGQYVPGGVLRHPNCVGSTCAVHSNAPDYGSNEYGFLYGANLVQSWITEVGGSVDVVWNASTWDPYRVVLLRTRINP
jgi:hypothetical protein